MPDAPKGGQRAILTVGDLPPLFTSKVDQTRYDPSVDFFLSKAPPHTVFGNPTDNPDTPPYYHVLVESGGASAFSDLTDVPATYAGQSLKSVRVNAGETGLEFFTLASGGDFSSNTSTSVVNELVAFADTTGKLGKRATGSGLAKLTSGVLSTTADNSSNWDTAYTDRLKWDGGATGLVAATGRTSLGLDIGVNVQAYDADLTTWAGLTPSANFQTMVPHTFAQMRTDLSLVIGTDVQAYDPDLTTWAGVTPAAGVATFLATPSSANLATAVTDETGSGALVFGTSPAITTPTGIVKSDVGLGNVTNDAQTIAAVVPNTAPSLGQILIGNGAAYAKQTVGTDATLSNTGALTISAGVVTLAKMSDMATASLMYRKTAGTGVPEVNTLATLKTDLLLTGTNSGDQTITLTGDVTGTGTGSFAATIAADAVTYAKIQNITTARLLGRATAGSGDVEEIILGTNLSFTGTTLNAAGGGGGGDASTNTSTSVLNEVVVFADTTGKLLARATGSGLATLTSGVLGTTANNTTNWDTAFTQTLRWDGGATSLVAATGRTSLALNNVTNDAQTKAAIVPNTAPASGQILIGNAGGTAYALNTLGGDATLSALGALTIAADSVTYSKIQNVTTNQLLGRATAGSGDMEEITLGTNLSFTGTTLNAVDSSAAGGSMTGHGNSNYTILNTDKIVVTNAAFSAARTWTMPAASTVTAGNSISIIDLQGTLTAANRINIVRTGADTFVPGAFTQINLTQNRQGIQFTSDGASKWYVTYPSQGTTTTSGQVMFYDATQQAWGIAPVAITALAAAATAGKILRSDGTNYPSSNVTYPDSATSAKLLIGGGTGWVESTPTYPTASPGYGDSMVGDGTNWLALPPARTANTAQVDQTAVTETVHVTFTVPANKCRAGTTFRITAWGNIDNGTTAITFTPRIRWGGTGGVAIMATPTIVGTTTAQTGKIWALEAIVTVTAIGASGTCQPKMGLENHTESTTGLYASDVASLPSGSVTIDTTASKDLCLTWTLSATTGAPHLRTNGGLIEILK